LAEKCGFQHMGTLQRHFLVENRYAVNCEIYELSREQFSDM
jgi:RimJ/RimL family protein N-acetyltransferase